MKTRLRLNGIPTAMFMFLASVALMMLLLPCALTNEPAPDTVEAKIVVTISIVCAVVIGAVLFGYGLYCYLFTLEVSPTQVSYSAPFRKTVVLARDEITAFGLMSYYGRRDVRFYVCVADKEAMLTFYQQNTEKCKLLFENKDYHKLLETENGNWTMAIGVYILCRQPGVYLLPYGNVKSMKTMEQIINMKATPTGSGCANLWNATVTEF